MIAGTIVAIDPGTVQSGWCRYDPSAPRVMESGVLANELLRVKLSQWKKTGHGFDDDDVCVIEMMAGQGMPVGKETFETLVWIGRFMEVWPGCTLPALIYRRDVKLHVCNDSRAKDPNVRRALLDRVGLQGTKKKPGPTYGVSSHAWPALAVAVTFADTKPALKPKWAP